GLKQRAIHGVAPGIVLGMPLHPQRKARGVGDADGLDGAILRHSLHDNALAELEDALPMQRVHPDAFAPQDPRKDAAWNETDVVAIGEDDGRIGMYFPILQTRHAM